MQKLQMFSVLDKKAAAFVRPFFAPTSAVAVRSFGAALRGGDEVMKDHPEDFVLYHVGEFDQLNGSVTPKELPEQVVSGLDLVNSLIRKGDVS